jgi:hypothetical protein
MVLYCYILEVCPDGRGYVNYVLQLINQEAINKFQSPFLICTKAPNWEGYAPQKDETGYVEIKPVVAGVDEWFDGQSQVKYNYTNIWFQKFIPKTTSNKDTLIID